MKKQNRKYIGIIIIAVLIIGLGISFLFKEKSINFRKDDNIEKIVVEDIHYIDKSLINSPINLPYNVIPESADKDDVHIISSNPYIVTVNDNNTITALTIGEVDITLISKQDNKITAGMKIIIE